MIVFLVLAWLLAAVEGSLESRSSKPHDLQGLLWRCQPPGPDIQPTNWHDCYRLAEAVFDIAPPGTRLTFSTRSGLGVDYHIPATFTYGSCFALIRPIEEHAQAEDYLLPRYLARTIYKMAHKCVIPFPHLGGLGEIGSNKVLALALLGPRPRPTESIDLSSNLTAAE